MRTVSTKLDTMEHEELINECNKEGITVSEKIRELVQDFLEMCADWRDSDEGVIKSQKEVIKKIPKSDEATYEDDDDGNLRKVEYTWFTDEEKEEEKKEEEKELKIIVKDIP